MEFEPDRVPVYCKCELPYVSVGVGGARRRLRHV